MLNFSVHSNESSDTMFLMVQEEPVKSVEEFYYDYRVCIKIYLTFDDNDSIYYDDYDEYDNNCDNIDTTETDIKSKNTPLFVFIDFLSCPSGFIRSGNPTGCQCHPLLTANGVDCTFNQFLLNGYHRWNSTIIFGYKQLITVKLNIISYSAHTVPLAIATQVERILISVIQTASVS